MSISPPPGRRRALRSRRAALSPAEQATAARGCAELLLGLDRLRASRTAGIVATYLPTDGEIDPNAALHELRARGWTIALPVIGEGPSMQFAEWMPDAVLSPNRFGIAEPTAPLELVPTDRLDVVLVPCVAVDAAGNRQGFGAGYYDRAFARPVPAPDATTPPRRAVLVGVVHDLQVVDRVEPDPWDVPMDLIVTGSRVITPRR